MSTHDQTIDSVAQFTVSPLLLSTVAAAKFLSVSPKLVTEFSRPGRLLSPAVRRLGRRVLYHRPTLERVLAELPDAQDPASAS